MRDSSRPTTPAPPRLLPHAGSLLLLVIGASCSTTTAPVPDTEAALRSAGASADHIEPATAAELSGEWRGVYHLPRNPMGLVLTLGQGRGEAIAGEVRYEPLLEKVREPQGSFQVRGSYDPVARTFSLEPYTPPGEPVRAHRMFSLQGVLDPRQPALGGWLTQQNELRYFSLARPERAAELTQAMIGRPTGPGGRQPNDATLIRWASRQGQEPERADTRAARVTRIPRSPHGEAANLFEDAHFSAHFGTTYDQLRPGTRDAIQRRLSSPGVTRNPGRIARGAGGGGNEELREISRFASAFREPLATEIVNMVLAHRVLRAWRAAHLARLERLEPSLDAFEGLERVAAAGTMLRPLWPREQTDFEESVRRTAERMAEPVLTQLVGELLAADPAHRAAVGLATWRQQHPTLIALAPPALVEELQQRSRARLDEVLAPLVAEEVAALERLGTGWDAVQAGNRWLAELSQRFAFALDRPALRDAVSHLQARREADLAAAEERIAERVLEAPTRQAMEDFLQATLVVPGDRQTPAGQAIERAAGDRVRQLDRAAYLRYFTPNERELLGDRDRIPVGRTYPPPDATDVRRAILRAYDRGLGGSGRIDGDSVRISAVSLLMTLHMDASVSVRRMRVLDPSAGGPYDVEVVFEASLAPATARERALGNVIDFLNELNRLGAQPVIHTFELTGEGWQSPSIQRHVLANRLF